MMRGSKQLDGLMFATLLMACASAGAPCSALAALFPNRPTVSTYEYGVDLGTWSGRAIEERRAVLLDTNSILPRASSQQAMLIDIKSEFATLAPSFVDPTKEAGGKNRATGQRGSGQRGHVSRFKN
jgi:hypothetical protein